MRDYLAVAVEAARLGGDILREHYRRVKTVEFKGEADLVTEVDRRSEKEIVDLLTSRFPTTPSWPRKEPPPRRAPSSSG